MTTGLYEQPDLAGAGHGGVVARRAVIRWAWRLFRREWRQQVLIVALLAVAVAATVLGVAVAANTPSSPAATFGTASAQLTVPGTDPHLAADIASLRRQFGKIDVIENARLAGPGTVQPVVRGLRTRAARTGGRCWHWYPDAIPPAPARPR